MPENNRIRSTAAEEAVPQCLRFWSQHNHRPTPVPSGSSQLTFRRHWILLFRLFSPHRFSSCPLLFQSYLAVFCPSLTLIPPQYPVNFSISCCLFLVSLLSLSTVVFTPVRPHRKVPEKQNAGLIVRHPTPRESLTACISFPPSPLILSSSRSPPQKSNNRLQSSSIQ